MTSSVRLLTWIMPHSLEITFPCFTYPINVNGKIDTIAVYINSQLKGLA